MIHLAMACYALVMLALTVGSAQAASLHKCNVNGTTTYQQEPCPSAQAGKRPTLDELNAEEKKRRAATAAKVSRGTAPSFPETTPQPAGFRCDGRQYCSQMTSRAEAKYFLAHCPGVKMDGDKNGILCEQPWCNR